MDLTYKLQLNLIQHKTTYTTLLTNTNLIYKALKILQFLQLQIIIVIN